jgi:oxaloacetate decarboxylase alpha subunit
MGYPPLVTPTSQIVGSQAVVNVLLGERYKMISTEVKNYVRGLYGRPPAALNPELQKKVLGDEEPATTRPADLLKPQMEEAAREIGDLAESEEDVISYAIFPQVAESFFRRRKGLEPPICDSDKCGFPAEKAKPALRREPDFESLYTLDENLLFSLEGLAAYPVA